MIEEILKEELVEIYFQPIVSIKTKRIFAFEALTRCVYQGKKISPQLLFNLAKQKKLSLKLDLITRKKAIQKFHSYYLENNDLTLFLNFESSSINKFNLRNNEYCFTKTIQELGIPSKNFMLEIKEDEISNEEALKNFCKVYKKLGFSIALDDFGTGNSTFDRINLIKPDLIKIDKSLFCNIKNNQINKEIVNSISKMCKNIGILVLAEGVEDKDSICIAMKKGINLFQGYYFSQAKSKIDEVDNSNIISKTLDMGDSFRTDIIKGIKRKREVISNYTVLVEKIIDKINRIESSYKVIEKEIKKYENIEAMYLIDEKTSLQVQNTVMKINLNSRFKPTKHGDEHYFKEYYYITQESKKGIFLSQKYISFASGNICKTFAKKFEKENKSYILCIDIAV
mgnify:CR=1 FL=1